MQQLIHDRQPTSWGWGSERQLLACRLSQLLGLLAVLMLLCLTGMVALAW